MKIITLVLVLVHVVSSSELDKINTKYFELNPIINADGKRIWFSVEGHPMNKNYNQDPYCLDIWYSDKNEDGTWGEAKHLEGELNNNGYNRVISVSPSGKYIVLAGKYEEDGWNEAGISISKFDGEWEEPKSVEIENFINKSRFIDYYLSNNGTRLLISAKTENSLGDRDLYYSEKKNKVWTKPISLGKSINSEFEDSSPFLAPDDKTLYFTSNRSGNHDIWFSRRGDTWTSWSEPKRLDNKINTDGWESYFTIDAKNNSFLVREVDPISGNTDIIKINLDEDSKPELTYIIRGAVKNSKTGELISAEIKCEDMITGELIGETEFSESTGEYVITLSNDNSVIISAKKENYYSISERIDFNNEDITELRKDIELKKIEVGESVRLNNIFFETGKSELLKESYPELKKVTDLLFENSSIKIEIQGHTDDIGNENDNLKLSNNRAKSVKDYLVSQGIDDNRITFKGFGETKPISAAKDMEARSKNRRVEFKIIEK